MKFSKKIALVVMVTGLSAGCLRCKVVRKANKVLEAVHFNALYFAKRDSYAPLENQFPVPPMRHANLTVPSLVPSGSGLSVQAEEASSPISIGRYLDNKGKCS